MSEDDAHDLMPEAIAATLPLLYTSQNEKDPVAVLKWFTPDSNWTWFVVEWDPDNRLAFGLVIGFEREFGYFSLDEIESVHGPMGLPIERDLHFNPKPTSECV